jgi:hypothetical protein
VSGNALLDVDVAVETVVGMVMGMGFDVRFSTLIHSVFKGGVVAVTNVDSNTQDARIWNDFIGCVFNSVNCLFNYFVCI